MADKAEQQLPKVSEYMPLLQDDKLKPRSSKPTLRVTTESLGLPSPQTPSSEFDEQQIKQIVRKTDLRILPLMFLTLNFNLLDKIVFANASVYGLTEDINLSGNRFSWASSIFYFGFLLWTYPATILIQNIPVGFYAGTSVLLWGIVIVATSASTAYGHLIACRFLAGALEASSNPAFLYITTMWYTREEGPLRVGVWFAGSSCGGIIGNLLSFGIGHVAGEFKPWRYLYIAFGSLSIIWGIILLLFLPNNVSTARGFTPSEKDFIERRISNTSTGIMGSESDNWNMKESLLCLIDPKTWFFILIIFICQVPNGGLQSFSNLVLTGAGFSSLASSLIGIPHWFIAFVVVLGTGHLASTFNNITTLLISVVTLPPLIGYLLMVFGRKKFFSLAGYLISAFGHAILPLTMSLIAGNIRGVTQKMTMTALIFITISVGNIIGPQLYFESGAPLYHTTFKIFAVLYGCGCLFSQALRLYLKLRNKLKDKEESSRDVTPIIRERGVVSPQTDTEERLGKAKGFRYRL